jgi:hypothetical protein
VQVPSRRSKGWLIMQLYAYNTVDMKMLHTDEIDKASKG